MSGLFYEYSVLKINITLSELSQVTQGITIGPEIDVSIHSVAYDSRLVENGDNKVFFALNGRFRKGIDFVDDAYNKGIRLFVVANDDFVKKTDAVYVQVKDTLEALLNLAKWHRIQFDLPVITIAGTHGKTTISCMLAHVLSDNKLDCSAFLGGIAIDFDSNFRLGSNDITVVEADEFDRSFLQLTPNWGLISSMDPDHLDIYGDESNLNNAFSEFSKLIPLKNKLFVHSNIDFPGISYGINTSSDYCAQNISIENGVYNFDLKAPNTIFRGLKFSIPGKHNLSNAVAAFAMALESGCDEINLRSALETYKGVKRRFSYKLKTDDLIFIDDYAHHPKEIDVVWEAVNEIYPNKKTTAVFQPHLYSRTKDFADDFAVSLSKFDTVLLLDIYPAREIPIHGVTSTWLLEKITSRRKKLVTKDNLFKAIIAEDNPILITMGAGDIEVEVDKLTKNLLYG